MSSPDTQSDQYQSGYAQGLVHGLLDGMEHAPEHWQDVLTAIYARVRREEKHRLLHLPFTELVAELMEFKKIDDTDKKEHPDGTEHHQP